MELGITEAAFKDYQLWKNNDEKKFKRIQKRLIAIQENSVKGIGKPEALKFDLQGFWSRRIDKQHRLVYKVESKVITIISCRYRYST